MLRNAVAVSPVETVEEDLVELWTAHRVASGSTAENSARMVSDGTLQHALERPDTHVLIARLEGEAVGYLAYRDAPRTVFCEQPVLSIDQIYVTQSARRHGVAQALIAFVAGVAERQGTSQIAANVPAQDRDANRYFTRLGFTAQTVRRVTTVAVLRNRLDGTGGGSAATRHRRLTIRARRRMAADERVAG